MAGPIGAIGAAVYARLYLRDGERRIANLNPSCTSPPPLSL